MSANLSNPEELLTPSEVAALFRVDPKTVTRWAKAGKLSCVKTLGGHRRYLASEVPPPISRLRNGVCGSFTEALAQLPMNATKDSRQGSLAVAITASCKRFRSSAA